MVLIRLRGCAGWSSHLLFANQKKGFLASRPNHSVFLYQCSVAPCLSSYFNCRSRFNMKPTHIRAGACRRAIIMPSFPFTHTTLSTTQENSYIICQQRGNHSCEAGFVKLEKRKGLCLGRVLGGGGGGTQILSYMYIRRLVHFWGVQNFKISIFLGVFRKMNIFWGMKKLWIFLGSSQNWTTFRGHFYAFKGIFLRLI